LLVLLLLLLAKYAHKQHTGMIHEPCMKTCSKKKYLRYITEIWTMDAG